MTTLMSRTHRLARCSGRKPGTDRCDEGSHAATRAAGDKGVSEAVWRPAALRALSLRPCAAEALQDRESDHRRSSLGAASTSAGDHRLCPGNLGRGRAITADQACRWTVAARGQALGASVQRGRAIGATGPPERAASAGGGAALSPFYLTKEASHTRNRLRIGESWGHSRI